MTREFEVTYVDTSNAAQVSLTMSSRMSVAEKIDKKRAGGYESEYLLLMRLSNHARLNEHAPLMVKF